MKIIAFVFGTAALASATLASATDVGVSISVGDPNFYGQLDIGNMPQPRLIYPQPVIIERGVRAAPMYLRVPPGHAKHWDKHCAEYRACGRPVYFVQDDWYEDVYVPTYRKHHGPDHGHGGPGNGHGKGHGHGHGHD
ncbi:MAG TPA: hypothetical protein VFM56_08690 [Solimonas sp.]|nr:hypothetical protein [Solimonas sp.]